MGDDDFRLIAYDLPDMAKNKQTNLLLMLRTWMSAIGVFATQEYKPQIKNGGKIRTMSTRISNWN